MKTLLEAEYKLHTNDMEFNVKYYFLVLLPRKNVVIKFHNKMGKIIFPRIFEIILKPWSASILLLQRIAVAYAFTHNI